MLHTSRRSREPERRAVGLGVRELCGVATDDAIEFDAASVRGEEIRSPDEYGGVRVRFVARLVGAEIPLPIDVGFGEIMKMRNINERHTRPKPARTASTTRGVRLIQIPNEEDDAADFDEEDISEKGTSSPDDSLTKPFVPRVFFNRAEMFVGNLRQKEGPIPPKFNTLRISTPKPFKSIYNREEEKCGFSAPPDMKPRLLMQKPEVEEDETFMTAIETVVDKNPKLSPPKLLNKSVVVRNENEDDVFITALGGEEEEKESTKTTTTTPLPIPTSKSSKEFHLLCPVVKKLSETKKHIFVSGFAMITQKNNL